MIRRTSRRSWSTPRIRNLPRTAVTFLLILISPPNAALEMWRTSLKSRTSCMPGLSSTNSNNTSNDSEKNRLSVGLRTCISSRSSWVNQSRWPQRARGVSRRGGRFHPQISATNGAAIGYAFRGSRGDNHSSLRHDINRRLFIGLARSRHRRAKIVAPTLVRFVRSFRIGRSFAVNLDLDRVSQVHGHARAVIAPAVSNCPHGSIAGIIHGDHHIVVF